jgi:hypothetical protein
VADVEEDISEVQVVDAEQVGVLSQQGWRLLKVVSSQSVDTLTKNYAYQTSPGSYPSTFPYSEQVIVQRSKFVMGRTGIALKDEVQAKLDQALRERNDDRVALENAKREFEGLRKERDKKGEEVGKLTNELKAMTERFEKMSVCYDDIKKKFDALQKATLETLVKLPGGNEVSIDDAGKMLRTSEILEGKS